MSARVHLEHAVDGAPEPFRLALPDPPAAGVVREGEHGAPPRRLRFELHALDALARNGIARRISPLVARASVDDGDLLIGPDAPDRLPQGVYQLLVLIDDVVVAERHRVPVEVDRAGDAEITLRVVPRRVKLVRPVDEFDGRLVAFLHGRSRIDDGRTLAQWLASTDPQPQPKRLACLMNVLAVLRSLTVEGAAVSASGQGRALLEEVDEVLQVYVDHVVARVSPDLWGTLREIHATAPGEVFRDKEAFISASHRDVIAEVLGRRGPIEFESYRFAGAPSMQIVIGRAEGIAEPVADIDIDLGNPLQDVAGLVVHVGELFDEGLDHVRLRENLARTAAAPFLYYQAA